jgi:hypothetical protein
MYSLHSQLLVSVLERAVHCTQDRIYVFPEMKLRGLVPNFHIHVSVSDLYIPTIDPPILLQQSWEAVQSWKYINRSQLHEGRN